MAVWVSQRDAPGEPSYLSTLRTWGGLGDAERFLTEDEAAIARAADGTNGIAVEVEVGEGDLSLA